MHMRHGPLQRLACVPSHSHYALGPVIPFALHTSSPGAVAHERRPRVGVAQMHDAPWAEAGGGGGLLRARTDRHNHRRVRTRGTLRADTARARLLRVHRARSTARKWRPQVHRTSRGGGLRRSRIPLRGSGGWEGGGGWSESTAERGHLRRGNEAIAYGPPGEGGLGKFWAVGRCPEGLLSAVGDFGVRIGLRVEEGIVHITCPEPGGGGVHKALQSLCSLGNRRRQLLSIHKDLDQPSLRRGLLVCGGGGRLG